MSCIGLAHGRGQRSDVRGQNYRTSEPQQPGRLTVSGSIVHGPWSMVYGLWSMLQAGLPDYRTTGQPDLPSHPPTPIHLSGISAFQHFSFLAL